MKLTTARLKKLIREEFERLNENPFRDGKAQAFEAGFRKFQDDETKEDDLIKHIAGFDEFFFKEYQPQQSQWLNSKVEDLVSIYKMPKAAQYLRKQLSTFINK
tara:strand:+ start:69 stop:377 length:309 start_codon:yes stop_codon:yes gene_type:complete